ncbi:MAG: hypothetical protein ACXW3D_04830 [Caulobacteraceae bacterium]
MGFSEEKIAMLEGFCAANGARQEPVLLGWKRQQELLWPLALELAVWRDARFDPASATRADASIAAVAIHGKWPQLEPVVGRMLCARLTQALTVLVANELEGATPGSHFPAGLQDSALTTLLLIYWCYEMELPLHELPGGGTA